MLSVLPLITSLLACRTAGFGSEQQILDLEVASPTYGDFLGDENAVVSGTVSPTDAQLEIAGEPVQVGSDGAFRVSLPMDGLDYRMIDVQASVDSQFQRVRLPVFSGHDPADTWPSAATARLTTAGLDHLGKPIGAMVDATGWETAVIGAIPSLHNTYVDVFATGLTHDPTVAYLIPSESGIDTQLVIANVTLGLEINAFRGWFVLPVNVGFDQVTMDLTLQPHIDTDGMLSLVTRNATIDMGTAQFDIGGLSGPVLDLMANAITSFIQPLGDLLLGTVLDNYGTIALGGPLAFRTNMMGTPVAASVNDLFTDTQGLGVGLGIGIDAPAPTAIPSIPTPGEADGLDGAQASVAVHEGALQRVLNDSLVSMLGNMDMGGIIGNIVGTGIEALPGGDQAPSGDGWCIDFDPGTATVVRMKESTAPLAQLHMPDFRVKAGVQNGAECTDWIDASLEVTIDVGLTDGSKVKLGVEVPGGALLSYGADPGTYTEDEVVAGLGADVGTLIQLAGGFLNLDLGSLLGGMGTANPTNPLSAVLGDVQPKVIDSRKLYNDDGTWTEGLYALSLQLWADE